MPTVQLRKPENKERSKVELEMKKLLDTIDSLPPVMKAQAYKALLKGLYEAAPLGSKVKKELLELQMGKLLNAIPKKRTKKES